MFLNTSFSNTVINLKTPVYNDYDLISDSINDPLLNLIKRHRSYPSIITIVEVCKKLQKFSFSCSQVEKKDILEELEILDIKKYLEPDNPSKIIKENSDIFGESSYNDTIDNFFFLQQLSNKQI